MTSSMHHDLARGRPLEVRWLSGSVVEMGTKIDVPTPANRSVYDVLALYEDGPPRGVAAEQS
jgi:2-dehydropantoate 2-reductase